jgi:hypothetical protein
MELRAVLSGLHYDIRLVEAPEYREHDSTHPYVHVLHGRVTVVLRMS